jgi:hypothetical protein
VPTHRLQWRAAEVLGMCVQNHPEVQQWALDGGVLPPLLALCDHALTACVVKAVLGLGSLVRNFKPGEQVNSSPPHLPPRDERRLRRPNSVELEGHT